jgi:hypothetical protein
VGAALIKSIESLPPSRRGNEAERDMDRFSNRLGSTDRP